MAKRDWVLVAVGAFLTIAATVVSNASRVRDWFERRTASLVAKVQCFSASPLPRQVDSEQVKGACTIQVTNGYGYELKGVTVLIPSAVQASIDGEPTEIRHDGQESRITIQALGQDKQTTIFAWLSVGPEEFDYRRVKLSATQQQGRVLGADTGEVRVGGEVRPEPAASPERSSIGTWGLAGMFFAVLLVVLVYLWRRLHRPSQTLQDGLSIVKSSWFAEVEEAEKKYLANPQDTQLLFTLCQKCLGAEEEISIANARRQIQPNSTVVRWLDYHRKLCESSTNLSAQDQNYAYYSLGCASFFIAEYYRYTMRDEKSATRYYDEAEKALERPVSAGSTDPSHLLWYARCLFRKYGDNRKAKIMDLYRRGLPQKMNLVKKWVDELERAGNSEWYLPQAWLDELKTTMNAAQ